MDSIFVLTKTNFDYMKSPSVTIGNAPYWSIKNRVCYHHGNDPEFIIHNQIQLGKSMKHLYDGYLHVEAKKPLYCISHYSVETLKDMCTRLQQPLGLKKTMYDAIKREIEMSVDEKIKGETQIDKKN